MAAALFRPVSPSQSTLGNYRRSGRWENFTGKPILFWQSMQIFLLSIFATPIKNWKHPKGIHQRGIDRPPVSSNFVRLLKASSAAPHYRPSTDWRPLDTDEGSHLISSAATATSRRVELLLPPLFLLLCITALLATGETLSLLIWTRLGFQPVMDDAHKIPNRLLPAQIAV